MDATTNAVRAWARGSYTTEAGVELLIRLERIYAGAPWVIWNGRDEHAALDIDALLRGAVGWSDRDVRVLRFAVSLIGGLALDLSEELPLLDRSTMTLVLAALAHGNGSHDDSEFVPGGDHRPSGTRDLGSLYPWPAP